MSVVTPSVPPSHYTDTTQVTWQFDPSVTEVAYTADGIAPVISNYIAYDTLVPPNPFIAVTQDGRGNVVYDGGFPKFYNEANSVNETATTFAQLNPSGKYLYNAITFCANKIKVAQGNRKILVIGDAIVASGYAIKGSTASDFRHTFERVALVAGYSITIKDRSEWGGMIDAGIAELDEYCMVIIMSSEHGQRRTTERFVNDVVTFRERGNGVIMITDHGPAYANIEEAIAGYGQGFFASIQPIAVRFGAYFSGDYNRTPVNVGFLRQTYGDHPLYANLTDSENIPAGGSESRVVVTQVTTYQPSQILPTVLGNGRHEFNFLSITQDGTSVAQRFVYTVGGVFPTFFKSRVGVELKSGEYHTRKSMFDIVVENDPSATAVTSGYILKNTHSLGYFQNMTAGGEFIYIWYTPDGLPPMIREGDVIELLINEPAEFRYQVIVRRPNTALKPPRNLSELTRMITADEHRGLSPQGILQDYMRYVSGIYNASTTRTDQAVKLISQEVLSATTLPIRRIYLYANMSEFNTVSGNIPALVGFAFVRSPFTALRKASGMWGAVSGIDYHTLYVTGQQVRTQNNAILTVTGPITLIS